MLLFVAALPGVSAILLRVYENTLVRQTEAELIAQAAALAATATALWPPEPGAAPGASPLGDYRPEPLSMDLGSTPVLNERPKRAKAVGAANPLAKAAAERLAPILRATSRTTLAFIVMTDSQGRILIGEEAGGSYASLPEVRAALRGAPATTLRGNGAYRPRYAFEWLSRASPLRIRYARPIFSEGRVVGVLLLSRSPRALFRSIYQDRGKILLGIGLIAGILVVLAGLVFRGITRPIEALSAASRAVAAGRGAVPETPETAAVEIRTLYEDFRVMAQAIERRSRYLRDFAAAVSHEFKTPLAGIRGAAELLQDHQSEMDEAERRRFLDNIAADGMRLSQLVNRLLEMAKADITQPDLAASTDLREPLIRVADALRAARLAISVSLAEGLPAVSVPETTVQAVLTTLIENSRQAGASQVTIQGRRTKRHVELIVYDDGAGIPTGDRDRIFEPFFTSRRESGGTGLGLSIARSMLAASQGELGLSSSPTGARFRITLPQASPR